MFKTVCIIGGGPAGAIAAIQLKRYDIDCCIVEKAEIGGLIRHANNIENYLGFPDGISGNDFTNLIKKHIELLDIEVIFDEALRVSYNDKRFRIELTNSELFSEILIIASGTIPKLLNIHIEDNLINKYVFYDFSKIENRKNTNVIIIGSGDSAFDYAVSLNKNNNHVRIVYRGENSKCIKSLKKRVDSIGKVKQLNNFNPESIYFEKNIIKILSKDSHTDVLETDTVLISIGRIANLKYLDHNLHTLLNKEPNDLNDIPIYFAGDIIKSEYRQISSAVGDGMLCAMKIAKLLKK